METNYASPMIASALRKQFGNKVQPVNVEMKYAKPLGDFIRRVNAAHQATNKSQLVFKGPTGMAQ